MQIKSVRGVSDILPSEVGVWQWIEHTARLMLELFGYKEIRTPIFEQTALFTRSIGEETDIVSKEMYTFPDKKGQLLSLRPEGTAPVVRAYLQHSLHMDPRWHKLYYMGPMFRYERPQAGRTRQFHQIGAEFFGAAEPEADAEQIILLFTMFKRLWGTSGAGDTEPFQVQVNTLGCHDCREGFRTVLRRYVGQRASLLCEDCRRRFEVNPLRILDCKNPACKEVLERAPRVIDTLCDDCTLHFDRVRGLLDEQGIRYILNPHLVRGLDYYTRTTFEITSHLLGAQNAIAGGGRYDRLVEEFGGPPTPACGFALGMERLVLALSGTSPRTDEHAGCFVFIAYLGPEAKRRAFSTVHHLRLLGVPAEMSFQEGSLKAQMKHADRLDTLYTIIVGEDELARGSVILKQMRTGNQEEIPLEEISATLHERFASRRTEC
ncbi:MAG: histidine--tRNA ligase [bacterium]